jgi:hypothetical protein
MATPLRRSESSGKFPRNRLPPNIRKISDEKLFCPVSFFEKKLKSQNHLLKVISVEDEVHSAQQAQPAAK